MKVTAIKRFCFWDSEKRKYFIVKVETDRGIAGLGEVGIPHWGGAIDQAIEHLSEIVIGADPLATEKLWQAMFRTGFFPADKVYSCALSAIDIALWDIKAKMFDVPLYKLLGGPVRDKVACYPHIQGVGVSSLVNNALEAVDRGWKFLRWHLPSAFEAGESTDHHLIDPRRSISHMVEQIAAVREAVGDEIELCIDAHTRLDTANAIELCQQLKPFRPFFIEDPLRSENPQSYQTLSRHTSLPIAAGEQWASKWEFRQVVEEELINYARIDLCIVGGITEAQKITHWCETHYIDIVPHNPLGPVSAAAGVALCMSATNVGVQEMPAAPGTYANDLFPKQIQWSDGYARCNEEPGLGVVLNEEAALSNRAPLNTQPPILRRPDGSINNW